MLYRKVLLLMLTLFVVACETLPENEKLFSSPQSLGYCLEKKSKYAKEEAGEVVLNSISDLFMNRCYSEVIELGEQVRNKFRDKEYSIFGETFSIFVSEDKSSRYTLESYERMYLSFLMAVSYENIGNHDAAAVEMRRNYDEGQALIYNYGDDPVNALLQATWWQNSIEPDYARSYWQKLTQSHLQSATKSYVKKIIEQSDAQQIASQKWKVVGLGTFPTIDWSVNFTHLANGSYDFTTDDGFIEECHSTTGMIVSTQSWFTKIALRYNQGYHPFLHAKNWLRFPVGVLYGVGTAVSGTTLALGGCYIDAAGKGNGKVCEASLRAGAHLVSKSGDVAEFALKPDMRHWKKVPAAILITQAANLDDEKCFVDLSSSQKTQLTYYY